MPRKSITCTCLTCGKAFSCHPYYIAKRGGGKYCSSKCYGLASREGTNEERFWALVDKTADCWLWKGGTDGKGYGIFRLSAPERRTIHAPRMAYLLATGSDPGLLDVCHACDTPLCVRPDHLFLGTAKDNRDDCAAKDRHNRGERNGGAKLTADDAIEIRRLYAAEELNQYELAERYGVAPASINRIIHRKTWRHI